jgi:hypothetical protein
MKDARRTNVETETPAIASHTLTGSSLGAHRRRPDSIASPTAIPPMEATTSARR